MILLTETVHYLNISLVCYESSKQTFGNQWKNTFDFVLYINILAVTAHLLSFLRMHTWIRVMKEVRITKYSRTRVTFNIISIIVDDMIDIRTNLILNWCWRIRQGEERGYDKHFIELKGNINEGVGRAGRVPTSRKVYPFLEMEAHINYYTAPSHNLPSLHYHTQHQ